jgi:hypothetical protein
MFSDTIAQIPFAPTTADGSGFLPPIVRAQGHVLYLLGMLADDEVTVEDEKALAELVAAEAHFHARADASETVSTATRGIATLLNTALLEASAEYPIWTPELRITNIRNLAHRVVAFSAVLDRELVGLTGSDPGSAL